MNQDIISSQEIEATAAFKSIKEKYLQDLILKRDNRKVIDQALIMHRTTKQLPNHLNRHQLSIIHELIKNNEEKAT